MSTRYLSIKWSIYSRAIILLTLWISSICAAQESHRDPYFGLHIHRADSGTAWPIVAFGSWRLWDAGVAWPDIEIKSEQWDFTRLDRYVAMARITNVDILLPLGLTPTWASARPTERSNYRLGWAAEPSDIENWRRYVRVVGERYRGKIHNFDLWNEINEKGFFTGSVEKLIELTCEAHKILHEISSDNHLVSPSLIGAGNEPEQLENFLRLGGKSCVDIIGYHFYVPHREPEEIVPLVARVKAVMVRQGIGNTPLWNTESGWWLENADGTPQPGTDKRWRKVQVEEGAAIVARSLILGRSAGLERFYWYAWDNRTLGLVEPSTGALKPAAVAYKTLIKWLSFVTPKCQERDGTWICNLFSKIGQIRRIAWHLDGRPASFKLPSGERLVAIEYLDGTRQTIDVDTVRSTTLGSVPVLIISTSI